MARWGRYLCGPICGPILGPNLKMPLWSHAFHAYRRGNGTGRRKAREMTVERLAVLTLDRTAYLSLVAFLDAVDHTADPDACWSWRWFGADNGDGYGRFKLDGRLHYAHRVAWERVNGPIPARLVIDHLVCSNRACVRPGHMQVTTYAVNNSPERSAGPAQASTRSLARSFARKACKRGHEFTEQNTRWQWSASKRTHKRECIACEFERRGWSTSIGCREATCTHPVPISECRTYQAWRLL